MEKIYNAVIYKEKKTFGVCFPDFLGCISAGVSLEDALKQGREALEFHIEGMLEAGEDIPLHSDERKLRDYLKEEPGGMIAVIQADIPESKTERINVTIPQFALKKIDRFAKKEKEPRSALIVKSCLEYIEKHP